MKAFVKRVDAWLDRSPATAQWQIAKWKLKYILRRGGRLPDIRTLLDQPHRKAICEAVAALEPQTVLEIGCGKGPNLYLLNLRIPGVQLSGTDPSPTAIAEARTLMDQRRANTALSVDSADGLKYLGDGSVDVILADAVLFYIAPRDIARVLADMLRIARKGIVLGTWHLDIEPDGETARYDEGTWVYDYRALLGTFPQVAIQISAFPNGAWTDRRWIQYGAIVVAKHC